MLFMPCSVIERNGKRRIEEVESAELGVDGVALCEI